MANEKVTGKTGILTINSAEIYFNSITVDKTYNMADTTDSATAGEGMESTAIRMQCRATVESNLYTAGGDPVTGTTLGLTIGGTAYYITNATYDEQYTESEVTDSNTAATSSEFIGVRFKGTSVVEGIMKRDNASKVTATAPASVAVVLTFASGVTVTGNAIIHTESSAMDVNDTVKVTLTMDWQGEPTRSNIGVWTMNTSQTASIVYETGTATNKEVTGNAICLGRSVTAPINDKATISYTVVFTGAIADAIYTAA